MGKHSGAGRSQVNVTPKRNARLRPQNTASGCLPFLAALLLLCFTACKPDAQTFDVSGRCVFAGDTTKGIPNAVIEIEHPDGLAQYVAVDTAGFWSVSLEAGKYVFGAMKRTDTLNGIDYADNAAIKANLLGVAPFTNQWQWLASDVNQSGACTTYDAFLTNAAMLNVGYAKEFIGGFWQFVPSEYVMPPISDFYIPNYPTCIEIILQNDVQNVNFVGFRRGDVTFSADVNK